MYHALEAVLKHDGKLDRVIVVLNGQVWPLGPQPEINAVLGPIEFCGRMPIRTDVEVIQPRTFTTREVYEVRGSNVHAVILDREVQDLAELRGPQVIDNRLRNVIGVEAFMHAAPWIKGEIVGLMVDETEFRAPTIEIGPVLYHPSVLHKIRIEP